MDPSIAPQFMGSSQEVDMAIDAIQKQIAMTPVAGLLLVREDLQSELALMAPTDTPLRNRLSRIQGNGSAHAWYRFIPTVTGCGRFLGTTPTQGFFARGGLPTAGQGTYQYMSAPYVSLGDIAQVTFFEQMAGKTYTDIKKQQIRLKMMNTSMMEEWAIDCRHKCSPIGRSPIGKIPSVA